MREQLVGYLLGALEAPEQDELELALAGSPRLQGDLARLAPFLRLLAADNEPHPAPPGLAERTMAAVFAPRARVFS